MLANGMKESKKVKESLQSLMEPNMTVTGNLVKSQDMESYITKVNQNLMETLLVD